MALFTGEPFVANARHVVCRRFKDAASMTVTFFAILAFSYKWFVNLKCCFKRKRLKTNRNYRDRCVRLLRKNQQNLVDIGNDMFPFRWCSRRIRNNRDVLRDYTRQNLQQQWKPEVKCVQTVSNRILITLSQEAVGETRSDDVTFA